jgi:thymidylate synthase
MYITKYPSSVEVRNVNEALYRMMHVAHEHGVEEPTRNGRVLSLPNPITLTYTHPMERVLFSGIRDANPFFHLMESLWILAGRDDVGFLAEFLPRMAEYSDDGAHFHGAYGHRLRKAFGIDQIESCIRMLAEDITTRRAVMGIWHPYTDLGAQSLDLPCNDLVMFRYNSKDHALDMTVCNRSNDIVWGMCGANAVHFSVVHEYVALSVGMAVGKYHQVSNNAHLYLNEQAEKLARWYVVEDMYQGDTSVMYPMKLFSDKTKKSVFDADMTTLFNAFDRGQPLTDKTYYTFFFCGVVVPMLLAWNSHRVKKQTRQALDYANQITAPDWRHVCTSWLTRRK